MPLARRRLLGLASAAGALALAAGCGGSSVRVPQPDAGRDGAVDQASASDAGDAGTRADSGAADVRADGAAERPADAADAGDARADTPSDVQMICPTLGTLTPSSGTVSGVLQGTSNNPGVSCRGGVSTLGPDAFYTLTVPEDTTIDLEVTSLVETFIAIRPAGCGGAIAELFCGADPPPPEGDAGVPPTPTDDAGNRLNVTSLRAPISAGTYTLVIDSLTFGSLTSAPFTLNVGQLAQRPNASCAAPALLAAGDVVMTEPLELAGVPKPVCGGVTQSSLFYTVGVPAGQRLTVRATPDGGDRSWMPRLEAFASCASTACLAQGHVVSGQTQQLDWINNATTWQLVYLAVGADGLVNDATFDLSVTIVDLFATCDRPMPVKDGTTLLGQDLSVAFPATSATCTGSVDHVFYYSATLLPQQTITVTARPSSTQNQFVFPTVAIRQTCDAVSCLATGSGTSFANQSTEDLPVIIEVTSPEPGLVGLFDLTVSMPPPPAGVIVTPTSGLVTTESGGTATFTVSLASPPTANVTIGIASDTPTEGTASPATLTFTPDDWRTAQTVTVTGVDDQISDGPRAYTIVTSPATSQDARYMGLDAQDVEVTNLDNDPGVDFQGADDVVTSESGTTASFTVSLNAAPTATVTMTLASSDVGEGTVSPAQVTFTTANWSTPQTVTVTGADDAVLDGTQVYTIVTGALMSADARYGGQDPPDISARNLDDDQGAVGLKVVSGDHSCNPISSSVPMAVDSANQLYVVMQCDGGLWLTTSTDAGVTFTDPAQIPGTTTFGSFAQVVGGSPGFAYLLFGGNDGMVYFERTTDGGATWSTPLAVSDRQDVMHLAAFGKTVIIATDGGDPSSQTAITRSTDGGKSFLPKAFIEGIASDVVLERDGLTAWMLVADNSGLDLLKSADAGVTFSKVGPISEDTSTHLIGNAHLFTLSGPLQIVSLADPSMADVSIGFLDSFFSMAVDDLDSVGILDIDLNGHLRATHVVLGQALPTDGRSLGPNPSSAGIVSFSRKAAGVAALNGNLVLYTTILW